jgi:hypothetical protein
VGTTAAKDAINAMTGLKTLFLTTNAPKSAEGNLQPILTPALDPAIVDLTVAIADCLAPIVALIQHARRRATSHALHVPNKSAIAVVNTRDVRPHAPLLAPTCHVLNGVQRSWSVAINVPLSVENLVQVRHFVKFAD